MATLVQPAPITLHLELRQPDAVRATPADRSGQTSKFMSSVMGTGFVGKVSETISAMIAALVQALLHTDLDTTELPRQPAWRAWGSTTLSLAKATQVLPPSPS